VLAGTFIVGCGSSGSASKTEPTYTILKKPEPTSTTGGVPPDKEAEVQLVLAQRDASTRRCYQDALSTKKDKNFKGTVQVLITLGVAQQATAVKAVGGTLGDSEVEACLVDTLKSFEYPKLDVAGDVQYTFSFRPSY
jgi:hypothetical protein